MADLWSCCEACAGPVMADEHRTCVNRCTAWLRKNMRRLDAELTQATSDLARVTAERDGLKSVLETTLAERDGYAAKLDTARKDERLLKTELAQAITDRDQALLRLDREVDQDRRARLELERVRGILAKLESTVAELGIRPLRSAQKLLDLVNAARRPGYRWCHKCDCAPCLCPPKPVSVPATVEQELQAALAGEAPNA